MNPVIWCIGPNSLEETSLESNKASQCGNQKTGTLVKVLSLTSLGTMGGPSLSLSRCPPYKIKEKELERL